MHHVAFTQAAPTELMETQDCYEQKAPGFGRRFRSAIGHAVERMAANPFQFPTEWRNVRHARARHFPYSLYFVVEGETLIVIACFQASRDPMRWRERV